MMLAHVGAASASMFPQTKNGAEILTQTMRYSYGNFGAVLLALMFIIACLNIGVGLTISLSQYFNSLIKKVPYKAWATIWVFWSYILANLGFQKIMEYSIPVLLAIYPPSLVLIILALLDKQIKSDKIIYRCTVYPTVVISIINTLSKINITIPVLTKFVKNLPLQSADLEWVLVTVICFIISFGVTKLRKKIN